MENDTAQRSASRHDCIITHGHQVVSEDWTSFLRELEAVLAEVVIHRDAFVVVKPDTSADLFVQFMTKADGSIYAEAASTMYTGCGCGLRHLIPETWQARLLKLGWYPFDLEPSVDSRLVFGPWQNFHRVSRPDWIWVAAMFSELLVRTLVEGFEVASTSQLQLQFGRPNYERPATDQAA